VLGCTTSPSYSVAANLGDENDARRWCLAAPILFVVVVVVVVVIGIGIGIAKVAQLSASVRS
jgi:hypothetical protein